MQKSSTTVQDKSVRPRFPCLQKGCRAVLKSKASLDVHTKYFHADGLSQSSAMMNRISLSEADSNATSIETSEHFGLFCQEQECVSSRKHFKNYAGLKQHYMLIHARKIYPCRNCNKLFAELARKNRHEAECGIKYLCSCGIAYHGKRGFRAHLQSSSHECPEELKHFVHRSQSASKKTRCKVEKRMKKPSKLSLKPSSTPRLIAPKFDPTTSHSVSAVVLPVPYKIPLLELPVRVHRNTTKQKTCGRFIIDVICPSKTTPNISHSNKGPSASKIVLAPSNNKIDSLSAAMLSSGIQCGSNERVENVVLPRSSEIHSKTSQTDWSATNQTAQDFSCQTDEFLAWLDSESEKYSQATEVYENTTTNTCTQTQQMGIDTHMSLPVPEISVTQHETQTDDGWLSELFHGTEILPNEVSNAGAQTSFSLCLDTNYNQNSNNNHSYYLACDNGCDIQTQTAVFESMTNVTTQTPYPIGEFGSNTSFNILGIVNNIQTQTENHSIAADAMVNTTHTQTNWHCDDLTEFLNMETQTELQTFDQHMSVDIGI